MLCWTTRRNPTTQRERITACGCGNFLVVAYRELRRLETDIIVEIRKREGHHGISFDVTFETKLTIGQFHGIEIDCFQQFYWAV